MKKHLTLSNLIFVILLGVMLYKPSRAWVIRQLSFSPSVSKASDSKKISDYNWQLKGLNAEDINFETLKGKVIFINFWATWCPPCIAEMPSIQNFYNDYKDKIAFVFVTSDNWQTVKDFYNDNNYDLPVHTSFSNYPASLPEVRSIPKTFVIDKNGYIRVNKNGAANWNSNSFRKQIDAFITE